MGKCTGWVVALAETFPAAMKAAKALKVKVDPGPYGKLSLNDIMEEFSALSEKTEESAAWVLEGDVEQGVCGSPTKCWRWSTPPTWSATPPWSRSTPRCIRRPTARGTSTPARRARRSRA